MFVVYKVMPGGLTELRLILPYGNIGYEINSYISSNHPGAIKYQKEWRGHIIHNRLSRCEPNPGLVQPFYSLLFIQAYRWGRKYNGFISRVHINIFGDDLAIVDCYNEHGECIVTGASGAAFNLPLP